MHANIDGIVSMSAVDIVAVIPTYNRGHIIQRTIQSVLMQSYAPAEIIVVDDGSTDDTAAAVSQFGDRVHYLYKTNGGSATARHQGFLAAKAPWVALLDSDDSWDPHHLQRVADAIVGTGGAGRFYFADTQRSSEENGRRHWDLVNFSIAEPFQLAADAAEWVMMRRQPMMLQSTVFQREAYFASGGFLPALRYRDDTHLYLKLGIGGAACAVSGIGCYMNDDDQDNRLTSNYNNTKRGYEMQLIMNRDLLSGSLPLRQSHYRELKQRLAEAHCSVARTEFRENHFPAACRHIAQSMVADPSVLTQLAVDKVRGIFKA